MNPRTVTGWIIGAILIFVLVLGGSSATYVVEPGYRGVEVLLGRVSPGFKPEGFGFKIPFVTQVVPLLIRQQTARMDADCYSSDLQQVKMAVRILYRVPESSVVTISRDYAGDPFESLVRPRVAEALNEITALRTAENIVQRREEVKNLALEGARTKIGDVLVIEDVVLEDIALTRALETAIEAKMVQQQEAARARFAQQQVQTEANTLVIRARGDAESIQLRGQALSENPSALELQIVEQWNGISPLVVGGDIQGSNLLLPLGDFAQPAVAPGKEVAR